ncbi:hypothetical protein [Streptomyces gobiensis]|uniref:hypothetical protein n=1 Tax=Streptomyces gobiensis TaxID=2875706 RepID=UPI001E4E1418|nr:hypothetical protein [Streptomyces gobiensis]UGY93712.1 hypothetical protein test1122_19655 [Streptomyces gobiensis]
MSGDRLCGSKRPDHRCTDGGHIPCVLRAGHDGLHQDTLGLRWIDRDSALVEALAITFAGEQLRQLLDGGEQQP